jgi:uncharacterized membrane protein YdbT with pleckstrin-like domain
VPTIFESSAKNKTVKSKQNVKVSHASMGPLTSFAMRPNGVRFETQEEQEEVVLFLRQHFIVNIPWMFLAIILAIAPTILFPLLLHVLPLTIDVPGGYIFVGTVFWYVATFGYMLSKFLGWFINIYIVTNERVVDIDFYYLLSKHFSQAELNKIQDISYSSGGIFAAIFNYGDVTIETAGESPNLVFEMVPHPEQVVEAIRNLREGKPGSV